MISQDCTVAAGRFKKKYLMAQISAKKRDICAKFVRKLLSRSLQGKGSLFTLPHNSLSRKNLWMLIFEVVLNRALTQIRAWACNAVMMGRVIGILMNFMVCKSREHSKLLITYGCNDSINAELVIFPIKYDTLKTKPNRLTKQNKPTSDERE